MNLESLILFLPSLTIWLIYQIFGWIWLAKQATKLNMNIDEYYQNMLKEIIEQYAKKESDS